MGAESSQPVRSRHIIALVGFMAAGKTTIGKRLARELGWRFVDLDQTGVQLSGSSIPKVFECFGEPGFRALERLALRRVLGQGELMVLATGGGTYIQPRCRAWLSQHTTVVYLNPGWPVLRERLKGQSIHRPLGFRVKCTENQHSVYQHYRSRQQYYRRAAHGIRGRDVKVDRLAVQLGARR